MTLIAQGAVILRLRLRGAPADPLIARLRIASALSATDLSPAGLPETAIVFIRTLHDPLPGRLGLARNSHMPPLAWQQAVGARIAALARAAARPAHGFVPGSAEAVWFNDRGELLACLARDWCAGTLGARWWWRSLLRDSDSVRTVLAEWLRTPEYAPVALQQLTGTGEAASFIQHLDDDSVNALLERVVERFGLAKLRVAANESESIAANIHDKPPLARESPWLQWVPEADQAGLTRRQATLFGVALLLQRAPNVARSAALAEAAHRWMAPVTSEVSEMQRYESRPIPVVAPSPYDNGVPNRPPNHDTPPPLRDCASIEVELGNALPVPAARGDLERVDHRVEEQPDDMRGAKTPSPRHGPISMASVMIPPSGEKPNLTAAIPQEIPSGPREPAIGPLPYPPLLPAVSDAQWVETRYGGVLYLINFALFLELYGDFTNPARPGIELPIWDFIALLGEEFIGQDVRRDPLWPLLAELAGRDVDAPPGADFTPAAEWRVPPQWIAPFSESADWQWSFRQRRLRVWHPGGFAVLDIPARGRDHRATLSEELAPYRASGLCTGITGRGVPAKPKRSTRVEVRNGALQLWLGRLLPFLRARLRAALGVAPTGDAGRLVCAGRARLQVTATHLDAYFSLSDLPIEVRLAGLDRDPGWVPAAGRYVRFHFD